MEHPLSLTRRLICLPIYAAMVSGGAFLIYEKMEGLKFRYLALTGAMLLVFGLYLLWADILSPIFRKKA